MILLASICFGHFVLLLALVLRAYAVSKDSQAADSNVYIGSLLIASVASQVHSRWKGAYKTECKDNPGDLARPPDLQSNFTAPTYARLYGMQIQLCCVCDTPLHVSLHSMSDPHGVNACFMLSNPSLDSMASYHNQEVKYTSKFEQLLSTIICQ